MRFQVKKRLCLEQKLLASGQQFLIEKGEGIGFMIMLSKLLTFKVIDDKGGCGQLADLAVRLLESDYPVVSRLFYKLGKKFFQLPWDEVRLLDKTNKQIKVADFACAEEVSPEASADYVLLKGQILDALLLDLQNRRAVRANDLQLREENGRLILQAADASISAILRRIGFGFYRHTGESGLFDWKYVEFLRGDPQAVRSGAGYHLRITRMPPGEIAQ